MRSNLINKALKYFWNHFLTAISCFWYKNTQLINKTAKKSESIKESQDWIEPNTFGLLPASRCQRGKRGSLFNTIFISIKKKRLNHSQGIFSRIKRKGNSNYIFKMNFVIYFPMPVKELKSANWAEQIVFLFFFIKLVFHLRTSVLFILPESQL